MGCWKCRCGNHHLDGPVIRRNWSNEHRARAAVDEPVNPPCSCKVKVNACVFKADDRRAAPSSRGPGRWRVNMFMIVRG